MFISRRCYSKRSAKKKKRTKKWCILKDLVQPQSEARRSRGVDFTKEPRLTLYPDLSYYFPQLWPNSLYKYCIIILVVL